MMKLQYQGPYTKTSREEWLENYYKHKIKLEIIINFQRFEKIQFINQEELDQIRKIWFYDKLETDDILPKICELEAKGEYNFEPLEDSHVFDHDI